MTYCTKCVPLSTLPIDEDTLAILTQNNILTSDDYMSLSCEELFNIHELEISDIISLITVMERSDFCRDITSAFFQEHVLYYTSPKKYKKQSKRRIPFTAIMLLSLGNDEWTISRVGKKKVFRDYIASKIGFEIPIRGYERVRRFAEELLSLELYSEIIELDAADIIGDGQFTLYLVSTRAKHTTYTLFILDRLDRLARANLEMLIAHGKSTHSKRIALDNAKIIIERLNRRFGSDFCNMLRVMGPKTADAPAAIYNDFDGIPLYALSESGIMFRLCTEQEADSLFIDCLAYNSDDIMICPAGLTHNEDCAYHMARSYSLEHNLSDIRYERHKAHLMLSKLRSNASATIDDIEIFTHYADYLKLFYAVQAKYAISEQVELELLVYDPEGGLDTIKPSGVFTKRLLCDEEEYGRVYENEYSLEIRYNLHIVKTEDALFNAAVSSARQFIFMLGNGIHDSSLCELQGRIYNQTGKLLYYDIKFDSVELLLGRQFCHRHGANNQNDTVELTYIEDEDVFEHITDSVSGGEES